MAIFLGVIEWPTELKGKGGDNRWIMAFMMTGINPLV